MDGLVLKWKQLRQVLIKGTIAYVVANTTMVNAHAEPPHNPHGDENIGSVRQVYDGALMPDIQVNTFRNTERLFPTRTVERGTEVFPLPHAQEQIDALEFQSRGKSYDLFDYVSLNRIAGLLVLKDGEIVHEGHHLGNGAHTRWMSMSIAKSVSAVLIGIAMQDGYISDIDDPVDHYVPELAGSSYEGVPLRAVLQMASGVSWDETYTDPASDRRRLLEAQIAQNAGGMRDVMAALDTTAEPGTVWNYSTGETQILAEVIAGATGKPLSDYLSESIWAKLGMEADATWWLESPDGLEVGGSGLTATLRDYGRFGQFLLMGGEAQGESLLPAGYLDEATRAQVIGGTHVPYGYMFWPVIGTTDDIHVGAYAALGILGQLIYVNPGQNVVIVALSARSKPDAPAPIDDIDAIAAMVRAVE